MNWEEIAKLAPIGTLSVATLALFVAFWSLQAQKGVARRRAATDFFLKTEMDDKMLAAYDAYKKGILALNKATDLDQFVQTAEYTAVSGYLNIIELMAVAIESKTFDERICYVYWREFVLYSIRETKALIDYTRAQSGGQFYYRALFRLHDRWLNNPELRDRWLGASPLRQGPIQIQPRR